MTLAASEAARPRAKESPDCVETTREEAEEGRPRQTRLCLRLLVTFWGRFLPPPARCPRSSKGRCPCWRRAEGVGGAERGGGGDGDAGGGRPGAAEGRGPS